MTSPYRLKLIENGLAACRAVLFASLVDDDRR
jgi:hypothetical protein